MKKIYEHSDDVHVKSCIAYGKAEDKKLYCEPEYKTLAAQNVHQSQNIFIVGNAQISPNLAFLNMVSVNGDNDFNFINQTFKHTNFRIGLKTGQNTRRMIVIKNLATKF